MTDARTPSDHHQDAQDALVEDRSMRPANAMRTRVTVLSPQDFFLLDQWGRLLCESFGETPYIVGSALGDTRGTYRDVDVRMLCDDPWVLGPLCDDGARPRLRVVNLSVTLWGRQVTGLPLDFQFQPSDEFHSYGGQRRSALGIRSRIDGRNMDEIRREQP